MKSNKPNKEASQMTIDKAKKLAQTLFECFGSIKDAHRGYQRAMQNNCSLLEFEKLLKNDAPVMTHIDQDMPLAKDANNTIVKAGSVLKCIDDSHGGDTDESWDIKQGEEYVVDYVHDEDCLLFPMVGLVGSNSGPVFPERFVVIK